MSSRGSSSTCRFCFSTLQPPERQPPQLAPESEGYVRHATALHNRLRVDGQVQYRPPDDRYGEYPEDFMDSDGLSGSNGQHPELCLRRC